MKRFFIKVEEIENELVDRVIDLLDDDLLILSPSPKADGTLTVDKIASIGGYSRYDIGGFASYCRSRKSRLVIEIPESDLEKITNQSLIIECTKLENGRYYEERLDFTPRTFKLIDYGAYSKRSIPTSKSNVVVLLPSSIENGKAYVTEKGGVIALGEATATRRAALSKLTPGGDLYIQTEDEKILDECRTWVTEVKEVKKDVYTITSKNYFLFDYDKMEEIIANDSLKTYKKYFNDLCRSSVLVYVSQNPTMIHNVDASNVPSLPTGSKLSVMVRREDIEPYLKDGIENLPFSENFTVINQNEEGYSEISLEDALDIPRTYIDHNAKSELSPELGAKKIHLFYEYIPGTQIPDCLRNCYPVEFEQVDMTDEGHIIYRKSEKIIQHGHNSEYADELLASGNRAFYEITGPNEMAIIAELGPLGVLQEFQVTPYETNNKKTRNMTHYTAKPYNHTMNEGFGTI